MKKMKKALALLLAGTMVIGMLAGCGKEEKQSNGDSNNNAGTENVADNNAKYTLTETSSTPTTWNVCEWQNNDESAVIAYTTMGLYDFAMNDTKDGYVIVPEGAASDPIDVTTEYAGNETYGVPADATESYAFKIELNQNAKWEDGTPINADTYIYSMQQMLDPQQKNYRASTYFDGQLSIANAYEYNQGSISYTNIVDESGTPKDVAEENMVLTLTQPVFFFGDSMETYYNGDYNSYFMDADGKDLYAELNAMFDGATYTALTAEMKTILNQIAANFGDDREEAWREFVLEKTEKEATPWESVGLIKNDDYTITLVLRKPISDFYLAYNLSSCWLLHEETYEANKKQTGDLVKTTYGTTADAYMSCGPYKITNYQPDKSMTLTKNENWYGWTDGNHEGQFMTTDIDIQYITEHTTILNLFLQGKVSSVGLAADDMEQYAGGEFTYFEPTTYTYKYTFNTDINKLKEKEANGINHSIIAYKDFRHAVSLAIDREAYVDKCAPASTPGFGLVNHLYVYEPETGALYRDSEEAKATLCEVYGVSDVADLTGYNVAEASKLIQSAYDACKADGNISDSDVVELDFHVYGSDEIYVRVVDFLQEALTNAAVGTSLEGKITVNLVQDENYYDSCEAGTLDLAMTAWGGASMDPYSMMQCYCDPTYNLEYGFLPKKEKLTINVDGQDITKTFYDWYDALCNGEYATAEASVKNQILAGMEKGLLLEYHMVPIYYRSSAIMYSQRIVLGSDTYLNSILGFGGIRHMTYTMNDEEWKEYCAEQNNQLTY